MTNLYVISKENIAKSSLCAGIGKKFMGDGRKVGYFVPVRISDRTDNNESKEVEFIKEILELDDTTNDISPLVMSNSELWDILTNNPEDFTQRIKKNYECIAKNRDVVVMEGLGGISTDNVSTLACYRVADTLNSRVILVLQDSSSLTPSNIARVAEELKQRLLGIVVNLAVESKLERRKLEIDDMFQKTGIRILGVLPEIRNLLGLSVIELSELLSGEILTCPEESDKIVADVMIGALTIDSGVGYFNRKKAKAVIVRGDRADMQLAALQTSVRCLVLTNGVKPLEAVLIEAERKHIPLIVTPEDISTSISAFERTIGHTNFSSQEKLKQFSEVLNKHLDFGSIQAELGL
jgi:uncharacterized protein